MSPWPIGFTELMRTLLFGLTLACLACDSFSSAAPPRKTRAPDLDCTSCFVVNAALATHGDTVFVGGYEDERGVLRSLTEGAWTNVELSNSVSAILQLSAAEDAVCLGTDKGVQRFHPTSKALEPLDAQGTLVWAFATRDVAVLDEGVVRRTDGDSWNELPTGLGKPVAVAGSAQGDLYVLDDQGAIARAREADFTPLSEQPPVHVTHIAVAGDKLLAISGEDHGDRKTGPGAILSFSDGHWSTLTEAPHDALLGLASYGEVIYAVGASRRGDQAIPVAWRFDGAHWSRFELAATDAFLWAAACTEHGTCYASGTNNTFFDLSIFD